MKGEESVSCGQEDFLSRSAQEAWQFGMWIT